MKKTKKKKTLQDSLDNIYEQLDCVEDNIKLSLDYKEVKFDRSILFILNSIRLELEPLQSAVTEREAVLNARLSTLKDELEQGISWDTLFFLYQWLELKR